MRNAKTKYYSNVYLIDDENRKKKLQELFLRSAKNDMSKWTKVVRYKEDEVAGKKVMTKDTDYFSPQYNGYVFQIDYDREIGIVSNPGNVYELVFDYEDYKDKKYPEEIKSILVHLMENVFSDGVKKMDTLIPKTQTEIAEETRNERSQKLNKIWGENKESE